LRQPLRPRSPTERPAILVSPIHEAQIVRADDGMDHVEYELLVVSVFSEPVTLSSVTVLDPAGKELSRIEGHTLAAATQTLFAKTATPVIPASAAVSVDVDLVLPPGTAPERVTHRMLEIAPNVVALYEHLQPGSLTVKVGDAVKAGAPLAKIGNTGPSEGPHLHFGLLNKPDILAGRSLPFVFDSFTLVGAVDLDASNGDRLVIRPDSRQVRSAYPLYGGIQNYP
jgi:Peptidase family M23